MAISRDYGTLQRHIVDDLGDRSDLLAARLSTAASPVKYAIQSAIAKWEREPFYFNEFYDTSFFATVNTQEVYTSADTTKISTNLTIRRLRITIAGARYMLVHRTWQYLDDVANSTTTGKPTDFAYFAQQIRLYPVPDGAYTIACSGVKRLADLTADTDTSVWTQDGYDLIRAEAKLILAREMLMDNALAEQLEMQIYGRPERPNVEGYLAALRKETALRSGEMVAQVGPPPVRATGAPSKGR